MLLPPSVMRALPAALRRERKTLGEEKGSKKMSERGRDRKRERVSEGRRKVVGGSK